MNFAKIEGSLSGHTSGGSITVAGCKGNVDLRTSGGGLQLGEIEGDVDARTSGGSIHADKLTGKSVLQSSGGGITVALGEKLNVDVDARTSGGRVASDLPVTTVTHGELKKNELRGKINGGGPLITPIPAAAVSGWRRSSEINRPSD